MKIYSAMNYKSTARGTMAISIDMDAEYATAFMDKVLQPYVQRTINSNQTLTDEELESIGEAVKAIRSIRACIAEIKEEEANETV